MTANQSYLVKIIFIMHNKCLHADIAVIAYNTFNRYHAEQHTQWLTCKQSICMFYYKLPSDNPLETHCGSIVHTFVCLYFSIKVNNMSEYKRSIAYYLLVTSSTFCSSLIRHFFKNIHICTCTVNKKNNDIEISLAACHHN